MTYTDFQCACLGLLLFEVAPVQNNPAQANSLTWWEAVEGFHRRAECVRTSDRDTPPFEISGGEWSHKGTPTIKNTHTPQSPKAKVAVEKLLTVEEVKKVSGIKEIKLSPPQDQSITFVTQIQMLDTRADFPVLLIILLPASLDWDSWIASLGPLAHVSGVGGDAREDRKNYYLTFHKGKAIVTMQGYQVLTGQNAYLSPDQMHELAKIIASRL